MKICTPPAYHDGAVYVGQNGATGTGLVRLDVEAGSRGPSRRWFYPTPNAPDASPAVGGGRVYLVDGRPDQAGRRLHCLDADTGRAVWTLPVEEDAPGDLLLVREGLFVFDGPRRLSRIRLSGADAGRPDWSEGIGPPVGAPEMAEGILLVATKSPPRVLALSPVNGRALWEAPLAAAPTTGPVSRRYLVAVGTEEGLTVVRLEDGQVAWTHPAPAVGGWLVCDADHVACMLDSGEIRVFDWDGKQIAAVREPPARMPPMLFADRLLYVSTRTLETVVLNGTGPRRWFRTAWLGAVADPPILAKGRLYLPTAGKGLVCLRPRSAHRQSR